MRMFIILLFVFISVSSFAARPFATYYFEGVANNLVGTSASHTFTTGIKSKTTDYYIFTKYEWADTNGKNLPFSYTLDGNSIGAGVRVWMWKNTAFIGTSYSSITSGKNKNKPDFRIGGAVYRSWEKPGSFDDWYAELFYVQRADNTLATSRWRDGVIITQTRDGKLWSYYVTQISASAVGKNAAENRIESGGGIGYTFDKNRVSANLELRSGYIFAGKVTKHLYLNPQFVISGSF
ncbi:MAG: hypothetical protein WCO98_14265 [bacterium]